MISWLVCPPFLSVSPIAQLQVLDSLTPMPKRLFSEGSRTIPSMMLQTWMSICPASCRIPPLASSFCFSAKSGTLTLICEVSSLCSVRSRSKRLKLFFSKVRQLVRATWFRCVQDFKASDHVSVSASRALQESQDHFRSAREDSAAVYLS